jgi:hypothetical protein
MYAIHIYVYIYRWNLKYFICEMEKIYNPYVYKEEGIIFWKPIFCLIIISLLWECIYASGRIFRLPLVKHYNT